MKKLSVILVVGMVTAIIIPILIMFTWNYLMPELFGIQEISLWQSFCMFILTSALFKQTCISK